MGHMQPARVQHPARDSFAIAENVEITRLRIYN